MQIELAYLLIVLANLLATDNCWTESMKKSVLEKAEIPFHKGLNCYSDSLGNIINIELSEHDLNDDGTPELLIVASGSYYLWGVTESACFIFDCSGNVLLEVPAVDVSVDDTRTGGYRDIQVVGRKNTYKYEWNENKYDITQ